MNTNNKNDQNVNKTVSNMASYATKVTMKAPIPNTNNESPGTNNDQDMSSVKPVFITELDLFGNTKPQPEHYLKHEELFKCVDQAVSANHLKGLQRVNGLWRIYLDNEEDRESLIIGGLTVRNKHLKIYDRNPFVTEKEKPEYVKVRVKNVPLSADDGQIFRFLETAHAKIQNYHRERLRVDGYLTNCQTGDRIFICDPITELIPRYCKIGKYRALVIYKGQVVQNPHIRCKKCLCPGHKIDQCPNDWVCIKCQKIGHKAADCSKGFEQETQNPESSDENSPSESESEGETTANEEEDEMIPASQSILKPVHVNPLDIPLSQPIAESTIASTQQSEAAESTSQQTSSEGSSDKKTPKKKKKKGKKSENSVKTGPMDSYLHIDKQSDKGTPKNQTSTKRPPTTPTDVIHQREVDTTKPRTTT